MNTVNTKFLARRTCSSGIGRIMHMNSNLINISKLIWIAERGVKAHRIYICISIYFLVYLSELFKKIIYFVVGMIINFKLLKLTKSKDLFRFSLDKTNVKYFLWFS
jgi:hypothetical protein